MERITFQRCDSPEQALSAARLATDRHAFVHRSQAIRGRDVAQAGPFARLALVERTHRDIAGIQQNEANEACDGIWQNEPSDASCNFW
jgi:hypothetical protein